MAIRAFFTDGAAAARAYCVQQQRDDERLFTQSAHISVGTHSRSA